MPLQNPLARIEQVAVDLERLADEIGNYLGAQRTFLYLRAELLSALADIDRVTRPHTPDSTATPR